MKTFIYTTKHKTMLGDLHTPVSTYLKVRDIFPQSALMESSDYHGSENNRSFIGLNPVASIGINHGVATTTYPDGSTEEHTITADYKVDHAITDFLNHFKVRGEYNHYCGLYAHQLGPAAMEEMLFRILGEADYHVIQIVFVLLNVAGIYCIYGILKEVSGRLAVVAMGTLLAGSCMASVFYTSWVYGEIPWVFCSLFSAWMLVRYIKYGKTGSLVGIVTALTLGTLLRKNTLVLVVAYCMVGAVRIFSKWDRRLLISLVLALALPLLCYQGIYKMYEMRSGMEHSRGLPTSAYLYLGMEEIGGRYGWYYSDCWAQYYATDCNTEQSDQIYREMMQERMQAMKAQPGYLRGFYQGKLLSQWNVPTYQSLYFNFNHGDVYHEKLAALEDRLSGDLFDSVVRMADRLQFIIYLGCLFYFIFCVRKDSEITQHLLAVAVIGGFLFSIFWEAKARYMYAYYMMMFPLAALGYGEIIRLAEKYCFFRKKKI